MPLSFGVTARQVFVGNSTVGGFSFADLREFGFFEANEPVNFGSCFLDYTLGIGSIPHDPVVGVSSYNVGVPSEGSLTPVDLIGAVREIRLNVDGNSDGTPLNVTNVGAFGTELQFNIRKHVGIFTNTICDSHDDTTAAVGLGTTSYYNIKIVVDGTIRGGAGRGAAQGSCVSNTDGGDGGDAIDVTNGNTTGARVLVNTTGIIYAGGGGGGAGQNGQPGVGAPYVCGSYFIHSLSGGSCGPCPGGVLTACYPWLPNNPLQECTYYTYCPAVGGAAGIGGTGGWGRGANNLTASLAGGPPVAPGPAGTNSTAGTPGANGGAGGDWGLAGSNGSAISPSECTAPTNGGASGFALRGNYGFMDFPKGDIRGTETPPVFEFTNAGSEVTVGYAGTNQVWEFLGVGSTVVAISQTQRVDILVVGGGSDVSPGGATGGGGGRVEYRQNVVLPSGEYTVHTGDAGAASTITHNGGSFFLAANGANSQFSQGGRVVEFNDTQGVLSDVTHAGGTPGTNSVVPNGAIGGAGGAGVIGNGGNGATTGDGCSAAFPNGGATNCSTGPYAGIGGEGGDGLPVNIRIGGNSEHFGSGGGGGAGWAAVCLNCSVTTTPGDMGEGTFGRGRRQNGDNVTGQAIAAGQGVVIIKFLQHIP
jgi:hypothetical protein